MNGRLNSTPLDQVPAIVLWLLDLPCCTLHLDSVACYLRLPAVQDAGRLLAICFLYTGWGVSAMTAFVCPRCGLPHAADTACLELVLRAGAEGTPLTTGTVLVGRYLIARTIHRGRPASSTWPRIAQRRPGHSAQGVALPRGWRGGGTGGGGLVRPRSSLLGRVRHRCADFYGAFRAGRTRTSRRNMWRARPRGVDWPGRAGAGGARSPGGGRSAACWSTCMGGRSR